VFNVDTAKLVSSFMDTFRFKKQLHNEQYVLKIFLPFKHNITEPDFNCEWFLN